MKMRESEIFNNYVRLAMDAGVISEDEIQKEASYKDKVRYDSLSFSDIEALYGHKFSPNEKEGETISDVAHEETAVVGPAYDAMNAVVENIQQRQNIMAHIALKKPNGQLMQPRYVAAKQELINALVSTGFAMDSADETDLMKLADDCAGRIHKEAIWGTAARILISAAISYGPQIIEMANNFFSNNSSDKKGNKRVVNPKKAQKHRRRAARRSGKLMSAFMAGELAYQAYRMVANRLPNISLGVNKDVDTIIESLYELKNKAQFSASIDPFIRELEEFKDAFNDLQSKSAAKNVTLEDYNKFRDEWSDVDFRSLLILIDNMHVDVDTATGTKTEEKAIRTEEALFADSLKSEIERSAATLQSSVQDYISTWDKANAEVKEQYDAQQEELAKITAKTEAAEQRAADRIADESAKRDLTVDEAKSIAKEEATAFSYSDLAKQYGFNV